MPLRTPALHLTPHSHLKGNTFFYSFSFFVVYAVNLACGALSDATAWRTLLGLGIWPAIGLVFFLAYFTEESPLWLERQALTRDGGLELDSALQEAGRPRVPTDGEEGPCEMVTALLRDEEGVAALRTGLLLMMANQITGVTVLLIFTEVLESNLARNLRLRVEQALLFGAGQAPHRPTMTQQVTKQPANGRTASFIPA